MQIPTDLSQLLDSAAFHSLSVVRLGQEWQANLAVERGNSFRVRHGATPSEAIAELFAAAPSDVPACPIPPPPY